MDLKHLIAQISYKIEQKPEGGFIARPTDPTRPPIEASTREELVQKIQQNALDAVSTEFPALKSPSDGKTREISFHIEHMPGGGFSIHSGDPSNGVIHATDGGELQGQFLEKILGFSAKHLMPEMSKALAAHVGSANINVVFNGKTAFRLNSGPQGITFVDSGDARLQNGATTQSTMLPQHDSIGGTIDSRPIVPESSNVNKVLGLLLLVLVLGLLLYFFYR